MKHAMLETVKLIPYAGAEVPAIDRSDFLSAVFGISVGEITGAPTKTALKVTLQHGDSADGEFTDVPDPVRFVDGVPEQAASGRLCNVDIDLLACKQFIKVSAEAVFEGGTNPAVTLSCALALGDKSSNPV